MKTVSPLKPTSLFLVLNLAPKGGEQGPQTAGLRPQTPGEAAPPPPLAAGFACLGRLPHPVAHQKEKGIFIFGGSGGRVWVCGRSGVVCG